MALLAYWLRGEGIPGDSGLRLFQEDDPPPSSDADQLGTARLLLLSMRRLVTGEHGRSAPQSVTEQEEAGRLGDRREEQDGPFIG